MLQRLNPLYWLDQLQIDLGLAIFLTLASLLVVFGAGAVAGYLKTSKGIRTNYTRKIFHFIVYSAATGVTWLWGLPATAIFGTCALFFLMFAIWRGEGTMLYEGIAREQDAPQRTFYLLVPFLATAAAGVLDNVVFGAFASIGYLCVGWGDAIAEPFGVRFGKHKYRVRTLTGIKCQRSLEGSASVFAASTLAASVLIFSWSGEIITSIVCGLIIGLISAVVEAFSPHGGDNFTIQVAASAAAFVLLTYIF
jgi:phytol kinase